MTVREEKWPNLEHYSDVPIFNTKAVVQQTGVAAPTLRAWERRYTLLSPERAQNDYRLYSERDVVMIRWLKEQVDAGMSISQAVALFRHGSAAHIHTHLQEAPPHTPAYYLTTYNMRLTQSRLLEAFKVLDETTANALMASMLAIYSVEQICRELIVPTLWQIGRLWEEGQITVSVEHFASTFFRGLLTNLFHAASHPSNDPLVIVCCAPGEPHEIAPLMLALLLRRAQMRVAFLGQSIEAAGLVQTIQQLAPAMVCVSLTLSTYLTPLIELAQQMQALPTPRPIFAFGGQVFLHYTHLIAQVPGTYLDGDIQEIITHMGRLIAERAASKT